METQDNWIAVWGFSFHVTFKFVFSRVMFPPDYQTSLCVYLQNSLKKEPAESTVRETWIISHSLHDNK